MTLKQSKAEVLLIYEQVVTIERKMDIVANKDTKNPNRKKTEPWQAIFAGTRFVLHAKDRKTLVEKVHEKAKRLYDLEQLRQFIQRRHIEKAQHELISRMKSNV